MMTAKNDASCQCSSHSHRANDRCQIRVEVRYIDSRRSHRSNGRVRIVVLPKDLTRILARSDDRRLLHELPFYKNLRWSPPHPIRCFSEPNSERVGLIWAHLKPSGTLILVNVKSISDVQGPKSVFATHKLTPKIGTSVAMQPKKTTVRQVISDAIKSPSSIKPSLKVSRFSGITRTGSSASLVVTKLGRRQVPVLIEHAKP